MAGSGMLMNFEIGDEPLRRQVKFVGGRWRDRSHAKRSAQRNRAPAGADDATPSTTDRQEHQVADSHHVHDERPTKRQRTSDRDAQPGRPKRPEGPNTNSNNASSKLGGISSRLFTSNPTPRTVFEAPVEEIAAAEPSNAPLSDEAENFLALGLSRRIAQHLSSKLEMKAPTSIQKNTIPPLVGGDSDAFLQAETGSGKTLAYLLPIVQRIVALSQHPDGTSTGIRIHRNSGLFAVVLAPTRELCKQIATVLEKVLRCAPWIVSTAVIGGESKKSEKARLRKGVNILIATPGRLADHLDNTKVLDVGTVRWLVLDEGDRLMEMGFEEELKNIVGKIRAETLKDEAADGTKLDALPRRRVTVLCSATMKMNVQRLGEISLQDAVHITASKPESESAEAKEEEEAVKASEAVFSAPSQLKQSFVVVPAKLRLVTLIAYLKAAFSRKGSVMKAIVFISCADSVDFHFDLLRSRASPPPPAPASDSASSPTTTTPTTTTPATATATSSSTSLTRDTIADAAYITSPANPAVALMRLHGSLAQPVRTATLSAFRAQSAGPAVLLTTDIASRGLDVPAVDLVLEYDPAFSAADHVHRVGRTARAGRPGRAALFLLPGCEEGYVGFLLGPKLSAAAAAVTSYEDTLKKGLATPVLLPPAADAAADAEPRALASDRPTPNSRAEALQLHLEQRLLRGYGHATHGSNNKNNNNGGAGDADADADAKLLLESARRAFRSHVRAYATHVREERAFFDLAQMHLGHGAKSFGLREAPGGLGGGAPAKRRKSGGGGGGGGGGGEEARARKGGRRDDDGGGDKDDEEAEARRARMRAKTRQVVMDAAGEFNIG
ncbi:DEAD-domain-containing protein [Durotheca rogersii]|uniref:DEAD-domain-containing protein n=1 Tax=Durotheca rogersii TaxID=419775 RepID=UPI0022209E93|nr:DEAD-domain-containing protein [Durotheca rogersii]KAI5861581.1 DEAD-domain-containing protein [Durotheca rogersii]